LHPHLAALHVRYIFAEYGDVVQNQQNQPAPSGWRERMIGYLSSRIKNLWPR
jgi:hypothetical protein